MSREWSEDKMIRLIELIRERPLIWNAENEDYKKRDRRTAAFGEVAECIGVQRDEVERKWKVLQTQYRREHSKAGGGGPNNEDHKNNTLWFGYRHMSFLKERNITRQRSGQIFPRTNSGQENGSGNSELSIRTDTYAGGDKTMTSSSSSGSKETVTVKKDSPKRKRFKHFDPNADYPLHFDVNSDDTLPVSEGNIVSSAKRTLKQHSYCRNCSRDDAAVYAEYIANKLRKYNMFVRAEVEHKINCALHEADLQSLQHRLWHTQQQSTSNRREDGHNLIPPTLIQQTQISTAENSSHKYHYDYHSPAERSPSVLSVASASSTSLLPPNMEEQ